MHFSALLAATSAFASMAFASPISKFVKFTVESDIEKINNQGLYSIHEGAAINYFFLGDKAEQLTLNTSSGEIYSTIEVNGGETYSLILGTLAYGFPGLTVGGGQYPTTWTFENGYLKGNHSDNFYVAKNTNDPYQYSKDQYQIGLFPADSETSAYDDIHSVKVKAEILATC